MVDDISAGWQPPGLQADFLIKGLRGARRLYRFCARFVGGGW